MLQKKVSYAIIFHIGSKAPAFAAIRFGAARRGAAEFL